MGGVGGAAVAAPGWVEMDLNGRVDGDGDGPGG
jgi:hypothetical protein